MKLNYNEFLEEIKDNITKFLNDGAEYNVSIQEINKTNKVVDGLIISKAGSSEAPIFYLEDLYNNYLSGGFVADILLDTSKAYYEAMDDFKNGINLGYEVIKDKIFIALINKNKNKDLLKNALHCNYLDLALIFKVDLSMSGDLLKTTTISNDLFNTFGVSLSELINKAIDNTKIIMNYKTESMYEILSKMLGVNTYNLVSGESSKGSDMYVIHTEDRMFGASALYYSELFSDLAGSLNDDLYILPSSIHEVIVIPKNKCNDLSEIKDMVKHVNLTVVDESDFLSDTVYEYKLDSGIIVIAQ